VSEFGWIRIDAKGVEATVRIYLFDVIAVTLWIASSTLVSLDAWRGHLTALSGFGLLVALLAAVTTLIAWHTHARRRNVREIAELLRRPSLVGVPKGQ
jgi:hypothetical protein